MQQAVVTIFCMVIFWFKCEAYKIEKVTEPVQHAEGPFWCPYSKTLLFIDTFNCLILRVNPTFPSKPEIFKLENFRSVGFIISVQDKPNNYVLFADHEIFELKWPLNQKPQIKKILSIEINKPLNQFNEGKADNKGRIWAGTLTRERDKSVSPHGGALYLIDEKLKAHTMLTNISISNGLIWNKKYTKFYFIDSETKNIDEYDYDAETGIIKNRRIVINIKEAGFQGIADGMNIDEDDNLWITLFGGHHVIKVDATTGDVLEKIMLPATYVTSAVWGGLNHDILYVTTSRLHLNNEQLHQEPEAGCIFKITGLGVKGRAANLANIK